MTDGVKTIYTIGYGGQRSSDRLVNELMKRDVSHVLDVRSTPWGYLSCFRSRELSKIMKFVGISYRHVPELGNQEKSLPWVKHPNADEYLGDLVESLTAEYRRRPIALLCAENPAIKGEKVRCHRVEIAEELAKRIIGLEVVHLTL